MLRCWQYKPTERTTFLEIIRDLLPQLRPDFMKVSYYGTLSPAEQNGESNNTSGNISGSSSLHLKAEINKSSPSSGNDTEEDEGEEETTVTDKLLRSTRVDQSVANDYKLVKGNGINDDSNTKLIPHANSGGYVRVTIANSSKEDATAL